MARYIDAEKMLEFMKMRPSIFSGGWDVSDFVDYINEQPTADVAPLVHAHWIDDGYNEGEMATCSVCGESYATEEATFSLFCEFYHYCPSCGAKMDEEAKK